MYVSRCQGHNQLISITEPYKSIPYTYKVRRCSRLPTEAGTGPEKLLLDISLREKNMTVNSVKEVGGETYELWVIKSIRKTCKLTTCQD